MSNPGDGLDPTWLAAIAGWLPSRRWFAGKQLVVRDVVADAVVPLAPGDDLSVTLCVLRVSYVDGPDQRYAVPVACIADWRAGLAADDPRVIAPVGDGFSLVDAMALPDGAAAVVSEAFDGRARAGHPGATRGRPRRSRPTVVDPADVRTLAVEQSNTSVLIGDSLIAKLVRRVEPGPNPDAELPAHLAALDFEHVPGLAATLEVDLPGCDLPADVVIVHDAIGNDGDLWSVVLDSLQRGLAGGDGFDHWFDDRRPGLGELLGRRTAELHVALADSTVDERRDGSRSMRPEPFTIEWQRTLVRRLHASMSSTQLALGASAAGLLTRSPDELLTRFDRLDDELVDAQRIRVHGDLHLGQILATGDDIVFIDFEGEPGVPIADRLVKRSPLTDLAGLLRSVDYVGRHAMHLAPRPAGPVGTATDDERRTVDAARSAWTNRLNDAIVSAYLAAIAPAHLVPADQDDAQLLLDLYLLDKGLYEIRYELANRPEWVGWPLTAVTEMITR